ncbi:MAG: universal stress protein [Acidaminococcus provencensis]|jgi:nucleotide-binding universal stress UspA family protein|uniref:universal stress protein n=1 Tax=Acidaminococcus provencensis TaxID=2058289 RepID=UPI000CF923A2|nr:universal stress protein [Acidaminococcus provencensis]MCH4096170.1 universal stress protein [Acidaminococcus provencensis]
MFEKILVPVDGSETAWRALDTARAIADKCHGSLVVIHVVQPFNNSIMGVGLDQLVMKESNEELGKVGTSVLQLAREKLEDFTGEKEFLKEAGYPYEEILNAVEDKNCTAIVIGSRGLSGIKEFFMGSVSSKVSQYGKVPVLIVK